MITKINSGNTFVLDPEDYFGGLLIDLAVEQKFEDITEPPCRGISPNKEWRRCGGQMTREIRRKSGGDTYFMYPGQARLLEGAFSRHNAGRKPRNKK